MVESGSLLAIEIVIGFGVPVGWGIWQLIDLRRENRIAAERSETAEKHVAEADADPAVAPAASDTR